MKATRPCKFRCLVWRFSKLLMNSVSSRTSSPGYNLPSAQHGEAISTQLYRETCVCYLCLCIHVFLYACCDCLAQRLTNAQSVIVRLPVSMLVWIKMECRYSRFKVNTFSFWELVTGLSVSSTNMYSQPLWISLNHRVPSKGSVCISWSNSFFFLYRELGVCVYLCELLLIFWTICDGFLNFPFHIQSYMCIVHVALTQKTCTREYKYIL